MNTLEDAVLASLCSTFRPLPSGGSGAEFIFQPDFIGFDGHFPGNPVLPGIVQILAGLLTVGQGTNPELKELVKCKFLRPVRPLEKIRVEARPKTNCHWNISISTPEGLCAQVTLEPRETANL